MSTRSSCTARIARGLALAALLAGATAQAQEFPTKALRIVVPFPPGGSADIIARQVGERLAAALGQAVVVDNRPGAGATLGADAVAKSPPDGHTLLYANTNIAINPSLYKNLPYDTARAFAPVTLMLFVPNLILVADDVPARSIAELVRHARANPGRLNYSSPGNGTFPHLAMELFKHQAGIFVVHIPYRGAAAALNGLVAKEVQVLSNDLLTAMPHVRSGRIRALAITSTTRSPVAPDVPTMAEAGLKDYSAVGWQGLMVPAGTPQATVSRLNAEVVKILADPALRERYASQGLEVAPGTPQQMADFIRRDTERWRQAVAASGARLD